MLDEGESVGFSGVDMEDGRARALGGTGRLWAGQCLPLSPEDFEVRDWVPDSGWPLSAEQMEPYYRRAEEFFDVSDQAYDERNWSIVGVAPPAYDPAKLRHLMTVYTPKPDLGKRFERGLERARRVTVLTGATVTAIETTESGRMATGVVAHSLDGSRVRIRAKSVVLCAGTIENARLLLLSNGLGNGHDLVGRYYQDHPNAHVGTVMPVDPEAIVDLYGLIYRRPRRYYPKASLAFDLQRRERVLSGFVNMIFDFGPDSGIEALKRLRLATRGEVGMRRAGEDLWTVARDAPTLSRNVRRLLSGRSPAARSVRVRLQVHTEQAPDPQSRVSLADRLDPLGLPAARIDWRIGDQDTRTGRILAETMAAELERVGLGTIELDDWVREPGAGAAYSGAYHYVGTTRMASSPERGVVDSDCQVHGIAGLYCCGGSVFPTGGAANPTLTMVALAIRLADTLRAE